MSSNDHNLTKRRFKTITGGFKGKRIAIVGDLMVDRYFWGSVSRVSPEAPVPVVDVTSESTRLGGAANVANNIQALGGTPLLVGIVGDDYAGTLLRRLMKEQGLVTDGIITDSSRPTTTKSRVIAHGQHVVRIDHEWRMDCNGDVEKRVLDAVRNHIAEIDGVIIEDYNKGVVTKRVIQGTIDFARKNNRVVAVDPKFENFYEYRNVTVFKPNRRETEEVLGGRLRTHDDLLKAGERMLKELGAENILLTRGEEGMTLFESNGNVTHLESTASHVEDVSGAGDTVIATLTMALTAGGSIHEAATLANCAAGVVVGSVGIVPIDLAGLERVAERASDVSME